jgi:hypothetical protein
MIRKTSIVLAAALGTSVLVAAAVQTGQDRQQRQQQGQQEQRAGESVTLEGTIIDLYHYMRADENDWWDFDWGNDDNGDQYREKFGQATGGPVGLLVKEERAILPDTERLYIVLAEPHHMDRPGMDRPGTQPRQPGQRQPGNPDHDRPGQDRDRDLDRDHHRPGQHQQARINPEYQRAMQMTGQRVQIIGTEFERDNVRAVVIREIHRGAATPGERQPRQPDRTP